MIGLTPQQSKVLDYLRAYTADRGTPPSFKEIADHIGVASKSSVARLVDALEASKLIRRLPNRTRGIEVVGGNALAGYSADALRAELRRRREIDEPSVIHVPFIGKIEGLAQCPPLR